MNMQAILKQVQKMQSDMMKEKQKLDEEIFEIQKSFVDVSAYGNKKIKSIKINIETISKEDIELLEDLIVVSINELSDKIDNETEKRLGKYTKGMPGMF